MDKNEIAVAVFDKAAHTYQDKFMDVSLYHDTLDLFCNSLTKQGAHVLELGCGPGNITRYLLSRRPDLNLLGTDLAPNMIALAKKNNPEAEFQLMDCRDIGRLTGKYDGIVCSFCLPYLSKEDAVQLIGDVAKILQVDGVLYLSTMEDEYSRSGMKTSSNGDELFVYYHEGGYLADALEQNGFTITDQRRQQYPADAATTDLIIIARGSS